MQYNNNTALLALITCKEGFRHRLIAGILFISFILLAVNLIFANTFTFELSKVAVDFSLSVISIATLLMIIFLAINQISKEIDRHIIYLILSRPVSRTDYILGKFFGFALLILGAVILLSAGATLSVLVVKILYPNYVPIHFSWGIFFISILLGYLGTLTMLALAIFFTLLSSSSFLAVIYTLSAYIIGNHLEQVLRLIHIQNTEQSVHKSLDIILQIFSWLIPNLSAFDMKTTAAYGLPLNIPLTIWTIAYGICYIMILMFVSSFIFKRKELT
jgi:ABC-type transport system involved in multi-copper enzyme maturation permease subunit